MMTQNIAALMRYRMEQATTFVAEVGKECRRLIASE